MRGEGANATWPNHFMRGQYVHWCTSELTMRVDLYPTTTCIVGSIFTEDTKPVKNGMISESMIDQCNEVSGSNTTLFDDKLRRLPALVAWE